MSNDNNATKRHYFGGYINTTEIMINFMLSEIMDEHDKIVDEYNIYVENIYMPALQENENILEPIEKIQKSLYLEEKENLPITTAPIITNSSLIYNVELIDIVRVFLHLS